MSENTQIEIRHQLAQCDNCGQMVVGMNFCNRCGQKNTDRNLSIFTLVGDFMQDYFSFDSKFFTTMKPLLLKPGSVPKQFVLGMRKRHIKPFRILIFSSFIFFFIWGITFDGGESGENHLGESFDKIFMGNDIPMDTLDDGSLEVDLGILNMGIQNNDSALLADDDFTLRAMRDSVKNGMRITDAVKAVEPNGSAFETQSAIQLLKMMEMDESSVAKYFIGNLSVVILLIQPFFALLLGFIYFRKRKETLFIHHLVFSFYYHAWFLIAMTIVLLVSKLFFEDFLGPFLVITAFVYLVLAIKHFYGQSWLKTIVKSSLVSFIYLTILIPAFILASFAVSFFII